MQARRRFRRPASARATREEWVAFRRQVLGVANKMLTVLANVVIWDDHATPAGIACLVGCLVCATAYRPAPLRREREEAELEMKEAAGSEAEPNEKSKMLSR